MSHSDVPLKKLIWAEITKGVDLPPMKRKLVVTATTFLIRVSVYGRHNQAEFNLEDPESFDKAKTWLGGLIQWRHSLDLTPHVKRRVD